LCLVPLCAGASARVETLLQSLSLKEKAGQMTQIDISALTNGELTLSDSSVAFWIKEQGVGSVLNSPFSSGGVQGKSGFNASEWRELMHDLQSSAKVRVDVCTCGRL
jgi:hypothetical protein